MRPFRLLGVTLALAAATVDAQQPTAPAGKTTFDVVCAACHSLVPPARTAPPMTHIVQYYRRAYATEAEGVEAIVRWVQQPDAARSKLPAHARERFGLMPAFPLPEAQLREVATYVWRLGADSTATAHDH